MEAVGLDEFPEIRVARERIKAKYFTKIQEY